MQIIFLNSFSLSVNGRKERQGREREEVEKNKEERGGERRKKDEGEGRGKKEGRKWASRQRGASLSDSYRSSGHTMGTLPYVLINLSKAHLQGHHL